MVYHWDKKKLTKKLGLLYKDKPFINAEAMKSLYFSFFHSYLTYGNIAWRLTYGKIAWCLTYGNIAWCLTYGNIAWCLTYGKIAWCLTYGKIAWCLTYGNIAWCSTTITKLKNICSKQSQ